MPRPKKDGSRPVYRTPHLDDVFFAAFARGVPITHAAAAAGYSFRVVYAWRDRHPDFAERWRESEASAIARLEAEADRRGVEGTLEPVYYLGVEVGQVRKYSDTLLIFRLKALDPAKYRDRATVEHTGTNGRDLMPAIPADTDPRRMALALLSVLHDVRQLGRQIEGEAIDITEAAV